MLEKVISQSEPNTTQGVETGGKKRQFCVKNVKTHHGAGVDGRLHWEQQGVHRSQHLHNTDSRIQVDHPFTNPSFLCARADSASTVTYKKHAIL